MTGKILIILGLALGLSVWAADSQAKDGETKLKVQKTDVEWKKILTKGQYQVLRKAGTEFIPSPTR